MTAVQERFELEFEGESVDEVQVRIINAGDGLSGALEIDPKVLHLGDRFACVLIGEVTQVNHKKKSNKDADDTRIRLHTVTTTGITEVEIDMAKKILMAAADNLARAKAARDEQQQIDFDGATEGQEIIAAREEARARDALDEALAHDDE